MSQRTALSTPRTTSKFTICASNQSKLCYQLLPRFRPIQGEVEGPLLRRQQTLSPLSPQAQSSACWERARKSHCPDHLWVWLTCWATVGTSKGQAVAQSWDFTCPWRRRTAFSSVGPLPREVRHLWTHPMNHHPLVLVWAQTLATKFKCLGHEKVDLVYTLKPIGCN